jgi:hypothetical protein
VTNSDAEDSNPGCQRFLKVQTNPEGFGQAHVFLNLFDLLQGTCHGQDSSIMELTPPSLVQFMMTCVALSTHAPCCGHGLMCQVPLPDFDVTGTPCQDFSPAGQHRGPLGPQMAIFLAWVQVVLAMSIPVVLHENVPQFWVCLLEQFMGHAYIVISIVMDCGDVGFPLISRRRRYTIMYNRSRVQVTHDPATVYASLCSAMAMSMCSAWSLSDCWLADDNEVVMEIEGLCQTRNVPPAFALRNMAMLLSPGEQRRLIVYMALWAKRFGQPSSMDTRAVFNLADNPEAGYVTWSGASGRIPGLRTNGGKLWVPYLGRWLTTKEQLAAMGVPVYPCLAIAAGVPCVPVNPGPDAKLMLGNMMHIASVGTAMLIALSCARPL